MLKNIIISIALILTLSAHFAIKDKKSDPAPDGYAKYAYSIASWGVYAIPDSSTEKPNPSVGRAPLYPYFLAAMIKISPKYAALVKNHIDGKTNDDLDAGIVPFVQMALMSIVGFVIFATARLYGSNTFFANLCMVIALVPLFSIAYRYRISENLAIPLFALSNFFLVLWFKHKPKLIYVFLCGLFLGLVALTRVVHIYYLPFIVLFIAFISPMGETLTIKRKAVVCLAITLGVVITATPWIGRNMMHHSSGSIGDTGTYGVLAIRSEMNTMSVAEALGASIYWLPDIGDTLAKKYLPKHTWERFDFSNPKCFRAQSRITLQEMRVQYAGTNKLKEALYLRVFSNPVGHLLAMIPLSIRGLRFVWIFVPFALFALWQVRRTKQFSTLIGASALTITTFVIHVGITHFRGRYGMPMVVGFAPLGAIGLTFLWQWIGEKRRKHF